MRKIAKPNSENTKHSRKSAHSINPRRDSDWGFIADQLRHSDLNSIEEFYRNYGIPRSTFYDAIQEHECMKLAHEFFMEGVGLKKLKVCEDKMLTMNTVLAYQLPQYLKRWKDDLEWRARLKEEQQTASADAIRKALEDVLAKPK